MDASRLLVLPLLRRCCLFLRIDDGNVVACSQESTTATTTREPLPEAASQNMFSMVVYAIIRTDQLFTHDLFLSLFSCWFCFVIPCSFWFHFCFVGESLNCTVALPRIIVYICTYSIRRTQQFTGYSNSGFVLHIVSN